VKIHITGIGLWGPGLHCWRDFLDSHCQMPGGVRGDDADNPEFVAPAPDSIPARERRRAPLPVRIGVELTEQACSMADVRTDTIATVFTSAMGDTGITDYMCRTLSGPEKMLSPTRFHNSVHNAPSGYWSIAAGNHAPSGYVGGFENSFSVGLLEAATLCTAERRPVVLAAYDIAHGEPFTDICVIEESFGCALLLDPEDSEGWPTRISCSASQTSWPKPATPQWQTLARRNPIARALSLLEIMADNRSDELSLPLNDHGSLKINMESRTGHEPD